MLRRKMSRWRSLTITVSDLRSPLATARSMRTFMPADVCSAVRSALLSTATATGSRPRPYTIAGIRPSRRSWRTRFLPRPSRRFASSVTRSMACLQTKKPATPRPKAEGHYSTKLRDQGTGRITSLSLLPRAVSLPQKSCYSGRQRDSSQRPRIHRPHTTPVPPKPTAWSAVDCLLMWRSSPGTIASTSCSCCTARPPQPFPDASSPPACTRPEVVDALHIAWEACGHTCSRRLHPFLTELGPILTRAGVLQLHAQTAATLVQISPATIDRVLAPFRCTRRPRGLSTTKPGTLLLSQIPIRTFAQGDDAQPRFLEVDLVAHCGPIMRGEFAHTTELRRRSQRWYRFSIF